MTTKSALDPTTVATGDALPGYVREPGFAHWNRFAAVNDEFFAIHMDDEAGEAAGFGGAFGMGHLQWSYFHVLLEKWMAGSGRIASIACQFRSPNLKDQVVSVGGAVTGVRSANGRTLVDVEMSITASPDTTLARGTATVSFDG